MEEDKVSTLKELSLNMLMQQPLEDLRSIFNLHCAYKENVPSKQVLQKHLVQQLDLQSKAATW